jgi:H+/Cl- antiporter ClcA/predicted transcriptional regulator
MTASPVSDAPLSQRLAVVSPFTYLFDRLKLSPETTVLLLAVLIGTGTGLGVILLHELIEHIHTWVFADLMQHLSRWGGWAWAGMPLLGGFLIGLMRWRWQNFGPSLATLVTAARGLQDLSPLRPLLKVLAAAISLATGASLGPEGPSVEIGAYFGISLGQVLQVSQERQRVLLGAGAAAGLAAGFNAPIAGVFLALEVVLGSTFATSAASIVLLAAVLASFVAQVGLGGKPAFALPAYEVRSLWELPLYLGLGILACLVSIAFSEAIQLVQRGFRGEIPILQWMHRTPPPLRPILAGACIGLVALQFPQIMGIGYETIEAILQGVEFSPPLLLILLVAKLLMTALSLGSGFVGGIFAPALFLGASLGEVYGKALVMMLPSLGVSIAAPPAYAMVGMAAVLAGTARAPLTAILLLFELTRDYRIVLPLMAAVGLTVWLVDRLKAPVPPRPDLQDLGLNLEKITDPEALTAVKVREAMQRDPLKLSSQLSILEAGKILMHRQVHTGLVVDPGTDRLVGLITLNDIGRAIATIEAGHWPSGDLIAPSALVVSDICTKALLCTYQDESLAEAWARMATRGLHQLPVVDRDDPSQILGVLTKEGIELASSTAVTCETLRHYLTSQPIVPETLSWQISLQKVA